MSIRLSCGTWSYVDDCSRVVRHSYRDHLNGIDCDDDYDALDALQRMAAEAEAHLKQTFDDVSRVAKRYESNEKTLSRLVESGKLEWAAHNLPEGSWRVDLNSRIGIVASRDEHQALILLRWAGE